MGDVETTIEMMKVCGTCVGGGGVRVCARTHTHTHVSDLLEIFLFWIISRLPGLLRELSERCPWLPWVRS